jgi:hypothetical protein
MRIFFLPSIWSFCLYSAPPFLVYTMKCLSSDLVIKMTVVSQGRGGDDRGGATMPGLQPPQSSPQQPGQPTQELLRRLLPLLLRLLSAPLRAHGERGHVGLPRHGAGDQAGAQLPGQDGLPGCLRPPFGKRHFPSWCFLN